MDAKNVVIYVAGQRFSIRTTDTEEYVIGIGEKVETLIKGIQRDNPRFNRDTCATLAALNLCDDEMKLRHMMDVLRQQVKDYLEDSEKLREENLALRQELQKLRQQIETTPAKKEEEPAETPAPEVSTETSTQAPVVEAQPSQPEKAPAPKEYRPDRKKKRGKHRHNTPAAPVVTEAPASTAPAETDFPEDMEFPDSPFQFSIFDTIE
ncbi:MAG: cell division protein ZapA [Ruminococcus sp.]|nr:cell division protein ZapA [Ruminococcus sp.]